MEKDKCGLILTIFEAKMLTHFDNMFQEFLHPKRGPVHGPIFTIFEAQMLDYFDNLFQEILIPKPGTILTSFKGPISVQTCT